MKIGLVTLYDDNYGTCLQAYALEQQLTKLGVEVDVIRYNRNSRFSPRSRISESRVKKVIELGVKGVLRYLISYKFITNRKSAFSNFRYKYLHFSDGEYYRNDSLNSLDEKYTKFVCGSDMIWSEEFIDDWQYYYLEFTGRDKCISYAPSFGKNEISGSNRERCRQLLQDILCCSCREDAGVKLIEEISQRKVIQVLDPTMLIDPEEWNQLIDNNTRLIKEPYTLTYVFGGTGGTRAGFFKRFCDSNIGKSVVIPMNSEQNRKSKLPVIGPIEFVHLFRDAEFIVTDTFHGLMFSLIFRKPFVVLKREDGGHWAKYSDRMTSTLNMFGLADRYIDASFSDIAKVKMLDYAQIESIIVDKKDESIGFLKNSLWR